MLVEAKLSENLKKSHKIMRLNATKSICEYIVTKSSDEELPSITILWGSLPTSGNKKTVFLIEEADSLI